MSWVESKISETKLIRIKNILSRTHACGTTSWSRVRRGRASRRPPPRGLPRKFRNAAPARRGLSSFTKTNQSPKFSEILRWSWWRFLNPHPHTVYFITRTHREGGGWGGGGGDATPPRVWKLRVVELSRKTAGCSRRVLAIGNAFDPRSIFDPVVRGHRSHFRETGIFSTLHYSES